MEKAIQQQVQLDINALRQSRRITPLGRDVAEALLWKTRKREDGWFQIGFRQIAGMAKGCSRDTAIEAVKRLVALGRLVKQSTFVWISEWRIWRQGKNVYRWIVCESPESENPTANPSKKEDSSVPSTPCVPALKEEAREQDEVAQAESFATRASILERTVARVTKRIEEERSRLSDSRLATRLWLEQRRNE